MRLRKIFERGMKKDKLRFGVGIVLIAAAVLYALRAVMSPLSGELERACQLIRAMARCLLLMTAGTLLIRPGMKPENIFMLLGSALGICYLVMILPGTVPDEEFHYSCTLGIASRLLYGKAEVDAALLDTAGLTAKTNTPETLLAMLQGLSGESLTGVRTAFEPEITSYALQYFPQVTGVVIGLLLGMNRWGLYLLADVCNLVFYLLIIRQAVKMMPKGKSVLMLIALLPMPLQQAGSLSPDGFINAMSFLYIAMVFRNAEGGSRLTVRELLPMSVVGLLLAPAKGIYSLMLLLAMIIPASWFGSMKKKVLYVFGMLALAVCLLFVFELTWMLGLDTQAEEAGVTYYTIGWCMTHPLQTIRVILNSALNPYCGSYGSPNLFWWLESGAGILLNTFTLLMPMCTIYPMLFIILLAALLVPDNSTEALVKGQRPWMLLASLLVFLSAFGIMMISWTPQGSELIDGVQGRYFVPVFPLLFLCFRSGRAKVSREPVMLWCMGFIALHWLCFEEIVDTLLAIAAAA